MLRIWRKEICSLFAVVSSCFGFQAHVSYSAHSSLELVLNADEVDKLYSVVYKGLLQNSINLE